MPNDKEFYPGSYGAFESSFSRSEESGAMGCGAEPRCNQQKWVTEKQKKFPFFHQKQVPDMTCVLKHEAYKACLAAANQPLPPDPDPGPVDTGDVDTSSGPVKHPNSATPATPAKPINWKMISLISVLVIIVVIAIVLIIRAKRAGKI